MKILLLWILLYLPLVGIAQIKSIDWYPYSIDPCCYETIDLTDTTYLKFCDNYRSPVIRLHGYKKFIKFISKNITEKNLQKLIQRYESGIQQGKYDYSNFSYEYDFRFANGKRYVVGAYTVHEKGNPLDEIIRRLNLFFEAFRQEHGCRQPCFPYILDKGENISTLSKKYKLHREFIINHNYIILSEQGLEQKALFFDYDHPIQGDIIYIPCLPQIVSEYEKTKE